MRLMDGKYLVGFARVDITPTESVPLRGYGNTSKRMSQDVKDPLLLTCIAFTDPEGVTALLLPTDLCVSSRRICDPARQAIEAATGVAADRILISSTHNHSSPDIDNTSIPSVPRYNEMFVQKAVEAAKAALADRKEATGLYVSEVATKGLNFIRRYILEDGTAAGDNYGHFKESPIRCHESEVDSQLQLVKITRQGGKDVVIANFQTHPHRTGGSKKYSISSDLVGPFRVSLEKRLDCHVGYITGGSGNVNPHSRIPEENLAPTYVGHGQLLADYAVKAAREFRPVAFGPITARKINRDFPANHLQDHLAEIGDRIRKFWEETGDHAAAVAMGEPYGINSPYHAGAVARKAKGPATYDVDLWTFAIGDVAFVGAPYEMFDANGRFIKENSPYAMTVICTCTNDSRGYMPSETGWKNGGYSVDTCNFCPGIGEQLADCFLEMLRQQKQQG